MTLVLAWYHGEKGPQTVGGPELLMLTALFVIAEVALSVLGPPEVRERAADEGDTSKNLRRIANEPGVATILEGGVQRSGDPVRICG